MNAPANKDPQTTQPLAKSIGTVVGLTVVCAGLVQGSASALLAAVTKGSVRAGTEEYLEFGQRVFCRSIMARVESASEAGS